MFSNTSKANLALARSPQVIVHQTPQEATQTLWHLARTASADAIARLVRFPRADRIDWNSRNAEGATLLMAALKHFSPEVVDALTKGPTGLFAGVDNNGDNILHHVVDRAGPAALDQMLDMHPLLAGYIDLPNRQHRTPLATAYQKRDDDALARLTRPTIREIDGLIDRNQARLWETRTHAQPPLEGLALRIATQVAVRARRDAPPDVFPFDREGILSEVDAFKRWMPHFRPFRRPAQSRLRLAFRAINDMESGTLEHLLAGLPRETLRKYRDNLTRAVLHTAHFPSVRVIARVYGEQMFAPLTNHENVLHLAACNGSTCILEWLFRRARAVDLLHHEDVAGRTPILRAAEHAQLDCIEMLAAHYPPGPITDRDQQGRGLLQTLFQARPASAFRLLSSDTWPQRMTSDDNTATLACAMYRIVEENCDTVSVVCDQDLLAHLSLITMLLQRPRGQIDVHARISPRGETIIDVLQGGYLSRALRTTAHTEQQAIGEALRSTYFGFDNDESLSRARAHL